MRVIDVAELTAYIKDLLESDPILTNVWVRGEISNFSRSSAGHIYFTLKSEKAQLRCALFRGNARFLTFAPANGDAVMAHGKVEFYMPSGQSQLIVDVLQPEGTGLLQLQFEELRQRLEREGLFDPARKRPLPAYPRHIGVVTSATGAVWHDIQNVLARRYPLCELILAPAQVQGVEAPATIIAALNALQEDGRADVIIVGRGGGSAEDLACFNDEKLARAIFAASVPVISAVGHETDFTIADFVADHRAPTPSAAAEIVTAAQHQIEDRIAALDARVLRAARYHLVLARQRLTAVSVPAMRARLESLLGRRAQRLDDLTYRLQGAAARRLRTRSAQLSQLTARLARHNPAARLALTRRRLDRANDSLRRLAHAALTARASRLDRAATRLHALSPLAVLDRGYALVYSSDGKLLRDAANAHRDDTIDIRLAKGNLAAKVTKSAQ
jgi:exodeoxyribonuclease VII large subunit